MTPTTYFLTESNLHSLKCVVPYKKPFYEKNLKKTLKMVDRQSYKEFPAAQEGLGRNGLHFSGNQTSNNSIPTSVSYIWDTL